MKVEFLTVKVIKPQRTHLEKIITGIMSKKYQCQYTFARKPERIALDGSFEVK